MDRIRDAAMLLKAKLTKDQTEELLIQATSEQNWQTPTPILHQICQVAYNYEEWQKIQSFIWEKLKLKKWRKVLKTLNLVEFLLKNGPGNIISSFKHEVYVFRSLDSFSCLDQGVDRGQSIRERSKVIVELLTNQQLLEEERTKAKTIKERMGESTGSGSTYKGSNSKGFGSGTSKYQSYDSKGKGKSGSGFGSSSYGAGSSGSDYNNSYGGSSGSNNLNKYKKDLGGQSAYKKTTQQKKQQEKQPQKPKPKETIYQSNNEQETAKKQAPKPFNQQGRKLLKPGEAPVNVPPINTKTNVNTNKTVNPPQNTTSTSSGFNFFDEPQPQTTSTPVPQTQTATNNNQINFNQAQSSNQFQQPNASLPFGQFQLPQQPQQPQVSNTPQGNNSYANQLSGFNFNPQPNIPQQPNPHQASLFNQQLNFGYQNQPTHQPLQQPQQVNFNTNPQSNQGLLGFGNITMNPAPTQNKQMFTMNAPTNNKEDEFGGFNQGHKQLTWMSADESSLVGLDDLSKQVSQKNVAKDKKKSPNEGNLLATSEDFDFMSTPSSNFNLGINFGGQPQSGNIMMGGYPSQGQWHGQQQFQKPNQQLGGISFF